MAKKVEEGQTAPQTENISQEKTEGQTQESKDGLLCLDKQDKQVGYVTKLDPETGEFDWRLHTPGDTTHPELLLIPTNTILDNFFTNFVKRYNTPSNLGMDFFRVPIDQIGRVLDSIVKIELDRGTRADRRTLERFKLNDEGRYEKYADKYLFEERELLDGLAALGISPEEMKKNSDMHNLMKGYVTNNPVDIRKKVGNQWVDLGQACLQAVPTDGGKAEVKFLSVLEAPQYKQAAYKKLFSKEQIERLEATGHLGETIVMKDFNSGRECDCFVSLHRPTNRLMTVPTDEVTIPSEIYAVPLPIESQQTIRAGGSVDSGDIMLRKGLVINGKLQVDACRGEVRLYENEGPRRVSNKVYGADINEKQRQELEQGRYVYIRNMRGRNGKYFSSYYRFSDSNEPLFGDDAVNYKSKLNNQRTQRQVRKAPRVRRGNNPLPSPVGQKL